MGKYSDTFAVKELGVIPEIALTAVSGMINELAKGFTGLLAGAFHGSEGAKDLVEGWDNSMVYEPRGEAAQAALQGLGFVMEKWEGVAKEVGDAAEEAGAPPALSTAAYSLVMVIPDLIGLKIGRGIKRSPEGTILNKAENIDYKKLAKVQKHEMEFWLNASSDPNFLKQMWKKNDPIGYDAAVNAGTVDATVKAFSETLSKKLKAIKIEVDVSESPKTGTRTGAHYDPDARTITLFPKSLNRGDNALFSDIQTDAGNFRHEFGHAADNVMWNVLKDSNVINFTKGKHISGAFPSFVKIAKEIDELNVIDSGNLSGQTSVLDSLYQHRKYISNPTELYARLGNLKRYMSENNLTVSQVIEKWKGAQKARAAVIRDMSSSERRAHSRAGKEYDIPADVDVLLNQLMEVSKRKTKAQVRSQSAKGPDPFQKSAPSDGGGLQIPTDTVPPKYKAAIEYKADFEIATLLNNALREMAIEAKHLPTELKVGVDKGMIGVVEGVKATSEDDPLGLGE